MTVRDFGAKGDGVSDDGPALQRAINETTGALVLGPGAFRIGKGLVVDLAKRGKTEIRGEGARIIAQSPEPALHIIGTHAKSADPKDVRAAVWDRESTPIIQGVEILSENPQADGIRLELTWQPVISQVTVHNCRHGIHLVRNNRNVIISECHIYDNRGVGVFLDGVNLHQIIVTTNHISYNAQGGIKVSRANVRNIQICGNDIEYNFDRADKAALVADVWFLADNIGIREATIVGNTIQALRTQGGANVRIEGFRDGGDRKAGLLNITGNLITNQEYNILIVDSRGIAIQGNTFILGPRRNIKLIGSAHVAVGPNVADHNVDYGPEMEGGVELEDCTGCTLTGFILDHARGASESEGAIEARNSRAINITGCNVLEPGGAGIALRGAKDCRVSDCIVTGGRPAILEDPACENNMVCHNRLVGGALSLEGKGGLQSGNLTT